MGRGGERERWRRRKGGGGEEARVEEEEEEEGEDEEEAHPKPEVIRTHHAMLRHGWAGNPVH